MLTEKLKVCRMMMVCLCSQGQEISSLSRVQAGPARVLENTNGDHQGRIGVVLPMNFGMALEKATESSFAPRKPVPSNRSWRNGPPSTRSPPLSQLGPSAGFPFQRAGVINISGHPESPRRHLLDSLGWRLARAIDPNETDPVSAPTLKMVEGAVGFFHERGRVGDRWRSGRHAEAGGNQTLRPRE
jgi:hypothetical protein